MHQAFFKAGIPINAGEGFKNKSYTPERRRHLGHGGSGRGAGHSQGCAPKGESCEPPAHSQIAAQPHTVPNWHSQCCSLVAGLRGAHPQSGCHKALQGFHLAGGEQLSSAPYRSASFPFFHQVGGSKKQSRSLGIWGVATSVGIQLLFMG